MARRFGWWIGIGVLAVLLSAGHGETQGAAKTPAPAKAPARPVSVAPARGEPVPARSVWSGAREALFGSGPEVAGWLWLRRLRIAVAIVLVAWLANYLAAGALRRAERRMRQAPAVASRVRLRQQQQLATLLGLLRSVIWYVIAVTTGILLLQSALSLNVMPLLTGAGIVGLAIAFGSQVLVRDMVTGFLQLLEGQYAVGDWVQIGGVYGKVEDVGLRVTRLRDPQNKLHFIPNGTIATVTTYDTPVESYVLQAPFADAGRAEEARQAAELLAKDLRAEYPELIVSLEEPTVVSGGSGAPAVKLRFGIVPAQGWLATEEVPARVKQLFADREIAIPESRPPRAYQDLSPLTQMPQGG